MTPLRIRNTRVIRRRIPQMKIAFGHQARVGKDTACQYMMKKYGGTTMHFSDKLYEIAGGVQKELDKKVAKDTSLLQLLGEGLRQIYGEDIWARTLFDKLGGTSGNVYIGDLRYKNEFAGLKERGFICVKIVKKNKIVDRNLAHKSEVDLADVDFDYVIHNEGSLDDFHAKLDDLATRLRK